MGDRRQRVDRKRLISGLFEAPRRLSEARPLADRPPIDALSCGRGGGDDLHVRPTMKGSASGVTGELEYPAAHRAFAAVNEADSCGIPWHDKHKMKPSTTADDALTVVTSSRLTNDQPNAPVLMSPRLGP